MIAHRSTFLAGLPAAGAVARILRTPGRLACPGRTR
jgi:hypothetical protein